MKNIKIIKIKELKAHEKTDRANLLKVEQKIKQANCFTCPIIVDNKNHIILDGHHRVKILKSLGYQKIPAFLVNYQDKQIKVLSRRKDIKINKEIIVKNTLAKKLFPYKTSKHLIPNRPKDLKINFKKLL